MSKKGNSIMMAYLLAASMASQGNTREDSVYRPQEYTDEELKKLREFKERQRLLSRGVKVFEYGDEVVYARNKKNADKKAKKRGLI